MASLVIVTGGEEFLMERAAREEVSFRLFKEHLEFTSPEGLNSYLIESKSPIFHTEPRAFIIWNCSSIPELPEGTDDLLIVVSAPGSEISDPRASRSLNFPSLKVTADRNEYVSWILKEGHRLNIDLSRVASALFVNCGTRLRRTSSEIEKLALLTPSGTSVLPDDFRKVACFSSDITPKDVVDSVCDGRTQLAIAYYDRLQERGDETGWILSYLHRHVLQMLKLELLLKNNADESCITSSLGVNSYVFKKFLLPMKGRWSLDSLSDSVSFLSALDQMNKRGTGLADFMLESEVIRLSEEARNVNGR